MKRTSTSWPALTLAACLALAPGAALAAQQKPQPTPPDNSAVNERDRAPAATTADRQSHAKSDVEITRDIRKAIVADKDLSTYAHNVKIVTKKGKVTLKGPVRSVEEKTTIETLATRAVGATNVTNQISIAPDAGAKNKKDGH